MITVQFEVTDEQALALAQFVKRLGWSEVRVNAESDEDAHLMHTAIDVLQLGLAEAGFAPR